MMKEGTLKLLSIFTAKRKPSGIAPAKARAAKDQRESVRGEVIKLSLRDTLARAKVPADWVGVELFLAGGSEAAHRRFHIRLILRRWTGSLVQSLVQIEQGFVRRMQLLDPLSSEWVRDVSWRFAMAGHAPNQESWSETVMSPRAVEPEPSSPVESRTVLLDPDRERLYRSRGARHDFSPTQPMVWANTR